MANRNAIHGMTMPMGPESYDLCIQQLQQNAEALQAQLNALKPTTVMEEPDSVPSEEMQPNKIMSSGGGSGSGGGGFSIPTVKRLPPIPSSGFRAVFWTSQDGGTGDDQVWWASQGCAYWRPGWAWTTKIGNPGN